MPTPLRCLWFRKQPPSFGKIFGQSEFTVTASATAKVVGASKICVLALDNSKSGALSLTGDAVLQANNCGAYSNSISATGLSSYKNSALNASLICSAGGVGGGTANFNPAPVVDCPATPDPLAGRPPPSTAGCDYVDVWINSETRILSPGVYCGGLHVNGSSHVTFRSGVYVMKDGPLEVTKTSTITGENVGFYLTGDQAVFLFAGGSTVSLPLQRMDRLPACCSSKTAPIQRVGIMRSSARMHENWLEQFISRRAISLFHRKNLSLTNLPTQRLWQTLSNSTSTRCLC